ncbi:MAG: hypothetical protein JW839_16065, partial [Candidatus Lokiarchaeota archaeon]|nr:hypothetical protein [Candidatus Lokiarchaeota archaeon]
PSPPPTPAPAPPAPVTYEYYVCNRCGEETSKSAIRQVGAFIECPKCKFTFSRAEATVILKQAPGADKTTGSDQDEPKAQFNLFASKQAGEDESLVRPSLLFADREQERTPPTMRGPPAKPAVGGQVKPRPAPAERLVRPSEYLGLAAGTPPSNQAAREAPARPGPDAGTAAPAPTDAARIAEAPASEYFVEEQPDLQRARPVPMGPVEDPQSIPACPGPSEAPGQGGACPKCGSLKYSKIQDRSKVISYNPLMYGYKKKCTMCSFEFD